jgi:hypothetical protein
VQPGLPLAYYATDDYQPEPIFQARQALAVTLTAWLEPHFSNKNMVAIIIEIINATNNK